MSQKTPAARKPVGVVTEPSMMSMFAFMPKIRPEWNGSKPP
jgi:hypothetical protein